ncbi:MAG: class I SAM-dependent methyltransferase [Deltaproteobacteria bacterium]|nr:class I SAM-dependent methyltransferase [Candidatus Desulfobacula maris]
MIQYPSGDHDLLFEKFCIPRHGKILDVGGGGNPFKYADVVVDWDFDTGNVHRDGSHTPFNKKGVTYIRGDIHNLPFHDNAFDFVICMQVLEHVEFPGKACEELMRVARKGFLETPRKWIEYFAGHPTHRWLVDEHGGKICFEPITYNDSPFMNVVLPPLWDSAKLKEKLFKEYSGIPCVQVAWEGEFEYQVSEPLSPKLQTKSFIAESHYYFALNLLHWMGDFETGAFHIKAALRLNPELEKYKKLNGFYSVLTGGIKEIRQARPGLKIIAGALLCRAFRFVYLKMLTWYRKLIAFL